MNVKERNLSIRMKRRNPHHSLLSLHRNAIHPLPNPVDHDLLPSCFNRKLCTEDCLNPLPKTTNVHAPIHYWKKSGVGTSEFSHISTNRESRTKVSIHRAEKIKATLLCSWFSRDQSSIKYNPITPITICIHRLERKKASSPNLQSFLPAAVISDCKPSHSIRSLDDGIGRRGSRIIRSKCTFD